MAKKIAIIGLGWLGLPLAKSLLENGHEITGSTTSSEKLMELLNSNLSVRIIKVSKNNVTGSWNSFINEAQVLIINIPPGKSEDGIENYPQQIEQIAKRCNAELKVVFVSSTSVYGNELNLATEESETHPVKESGKAVLAAEKVIEQHFKSNATIVRMAGLFGKNRHPGRFLRTGKIIGNPNGKVNLIHLDDCIQLISAIIEQNCYGEIFNGCADQHPSRSEFYKKAAYALSLEPPLFQEYGTGSNKLVSNEKSKMTFGIQYKYADPSSYLTE